MKKFAFISDLIFTFFVSALVSLCLFRYLSVSLLLSLILCVVCGALVTFSVGAFLASRRKNFFLKKSDEAQKQKLLSHLALNTDENNTEFFRAFLQSQASEENPYVVKRTAKLKLCTQDSFYFLRFRFAPVTRDDVAEIYRQKTDKQKILFCAAIEEDAKSLCDRLEIEVRTGEQIYADLKKAEALPTVFCGEECANKKVKHKFKLWFAKTNSKRFLVSAALILLVSRLTPFYYYYLAFGILLLLSAIFIRIFGYE